MYICKLVVKYIYICGNIKCMMKGFIDKASKIRESINIVLYNSKSKVEKHLDGWSTFMVLAGFFSYLQYYGFPKNDFLDIFFLYSFKTLIWLQIIKYIVGYIYSFQTLKYLSDSKVELIFILGVFVNMFLYAINIDLIKIVGVNFNFKGGIGELRIYVEQLYFMFFFFIEISKVSTRIPTIKLSPPTLLLLSFLSLFFLGAMLLMLPKMTVADGSMPFFDAFFTSISASCVTGLTVVNTATYFTLQGQFVILILIQLGGLNIISFATIFALIARRRVGIKYQSILQNNFNIESIKDSRILIKKVFIFSFFIEVLGAIFIYFSWGESTHFHSFRDQVFTSIFHSISAFNNAGFSTLPNGLFELGIQQQSFLQIVIAILIILGGFGFTVLIDVFNIKNIKGMFFNSLHKISLNSKIGIYTTFALLIVGTFAFFLLEYDNTLQNMTFYQKMATSFFQSVTTRTAGFNTVDIGEVKLPMIVLMLFLMYIGASPASTGGGIKTNTFTILFLSAYTTLKGKKSIDINKKSISFDSVNKALLIFLFSVSVLFLSVFVLTISDGNIPILDLVFEEVSAFATVGLSRGITDDLSSIGRIVIMISMFIGRVGLLTLVYALSKRITFSQYTYPKAKIIIG